MKRAILRLAPVLSSDDLREPTAVRHAQVFDAGSLEVVADVVPVLVDHEHDRVVGWVRDVYAREDERGERWYFASVALDSPPGWLRPDGAVSLAFSAMRSLDMAGGWTRVLRATLNEVSLLSPGVEPAIGRASVYWMGDEPANEWDPDVIDGPTVTARRYFPAAVIER